MPPVISVSNLSKVYGSGFKALNDVSLDIARGDIDEAYALVEYLYRFV